jgi:hypothetical protein
MQPRFSPGDKVTEERQKQSPTYAVHNEFVDVSPAVPTAAVASSAATTSSSSTAGPAVAPAPAATAASC